MFIRLFSKTDNIKVFEEEEEEEEEEDKKMKKIKRKKHGFIYIVGKGMLYHSLVQGY